ncbi:hypothetical protein AGMMS49532_07390 [Endomicrobiia bacterium]|nr:hypothetical protein AGMMS49532_07390 [Endomicrobiia bacterium]
METRNLEKLLGYISKIILERKIIGIFDRDNDDVIKRIEGEKEYISYLNNVYAFCITLVNKDIYEADYISMEHYFIKKDLCKQDKEGRRLFLGSEFFDSGKSKGENGSFEVEMEKGKLKKNKIGKNVVIDSAVYLSSDREYKNSIALSKADFAELVANNNEFAGEFDFSNFESIFKKIKQIIE